MFPESIAGQFNFFRNIL